MGGLGLTSARLQRLDLTEPAHPGSPQEQKRAGHQYPVSVRRDTSLALSESLFFNQRPKGSLRRQRGDPSQISPREQLMVPR